MTIAQPHIEEIPGRVWTYWPDQATCGDCGSESSDDYGRCYEDDHRESDAGEFVLRRIK